MAPGDQNERKTGLRRRLHQLETELDEIQSELAKLGAGEVLNGLYLVFDVNGLAAMLPTNLVKEVVRLVEWTPLPQAPPHVLGTFLYRGEPVIAVDLARYLGATSEPRLDAHVLVLNTLRAMAVVVDRVRALIEDPVLTANDQNQNVYYGLMVALCRNGDELLPLLRINTLLEGVPR